MHPLVEYFRCPDNVADVLRAPEALPPDAGFFRVGDSVVYGRQAVAPAALRPPANLVDVLPAVSAGDGDVSLPFELGEVLDNLRLERYPKADAAIRRFARSRVARSVYYSLRPYMSVRMRKPIQKLSWVGWRRIPFPRWPVDTTVETVMRTTVGVLLESGKIREFPFIWFWPDGASGCVAMTHDVESAQGAAFCEQLMDLDERFGIEAAYQIVPDAPWLSSLEARRLVEQLLRGGFEVNVHDLNHDGRLFRSRKLFLKRVAAINARGRDFGARGFRSGAMYRRQDWFTDLDFSYDMSIPNVAHLEPQSGGCCTVMPFFVGRLLELPLTTAQDYTVFHLLGEYSTRLWQEQVDQIVEQNGLATFIVHPDYVRKPRALAVYEDLLRLLVQLREKRGAWIARPAEIDAWWRSRREMKLVRDGKSWRVEGRGSERARVAFARVANTRVVYQAESSRRAA